MLKISVVGIGNAGNQVADLAKRNGIEGLALNSSERDIASLHDVTSMVIGDEKGAGKDRNIAKEFIQKAARDLIGEPTLKEMIGVSDVVYIVSSTGGGTGSGMAPVLSDVLGRIYPAKKFILVGILPPLNESIAAQQNTIEYLKEMRQSNPVYALYDNNNFNHLRTSEMLTTVNREIVEDMLVVRGDYQHNTPYNSIDEKDMLKIIETGGRLVINRATGFKEKDIDTKGIEDRLVDALKANAHAELDRDQIIKRLGLIVNLNNKVYPTLDTNLPAYKDIVGEPIEGFEHIYINADESETNRVVTLMSGLSVPDDRIEKIVQRIDEASAALSKVKESSILDEASTDSLDLLRQSGKDSDNDPNAKEIDLDNIFDLYTKK
jgi:tubulin-like protein CetZ